MGRVEDAAAAGAQAVQARVDGAIIDTRSLERHIVEWFEDGRFDADELEAMDEGFPAHFATREDDETEEDLLREAGDPNPGGLDDSALDGDTPTWADDPDGLVEGPVVTIEVDVAFDGPETEGWLNEERDAAVFAAARLFGVACREVRNPGYGGWPTFRLTGERSLVEAFYREWYCDNSAAPGTDDDFDTFLVDAP